MLSDFHFARTVWSSPVFLSRDVDDVHDMMDDISEQNEIAEEIGTALSTPIGFNQEIDDVRRGDHNR